MHKVLKQNNAIVYRQKKSSAKLPKHFFYMVTGGGNAIMLLLRRTLVRLVLYAAIGSSIFLLILFQACTLKPSHHVNRSFYYWKSVFNLTAFEQQQLDALHINQLYIKYFDVDWNTVTRQAQPLAKISFQSVQPITKKNISVVPVVFITNNCLVQISDEKVAALANNIIHLIEQINSANHINTIGEWQIDCDWTAITMLKYFQLLKLIHTHTLQHKIQLSATIRLYQCKYINKTGVPPVDKGLLMCYNMGNLKSPATNNSIIETKELQKYIDNLGAYPLPLDVALPIFDWKVLFRNYQYTGLLNDFADSLLKQTFIQQQNNRFTFLMDTTLAGYAFKKNDVLRVEQSNSNEVYQSAKLISDKIATQNISVSLYHLDSITLVKHTTNELEKLFSGFD